jgi:Polyketide cyclase / dehydrase and lipid transport
MKIIKWIAIVVALFVAVGLLMPGLTHIERSIEINAPAKTVFAQINELKNWTNWSSWHKLDPNTAYTYSQPLSAGTGAYYEWKSTKLGDGKLTILDTKDNENVHCKMVFGGMGESFADFKLTAPDSTKTQVKWAYDADNGLNPLSRWAGLMMDKWVGPDYEKGLANLKAYCETVK